MPRGRPRGVYASFRYAPIRLLLHSLPLPALPRPQWTASERDRFLAAITAVVNLLVDIVPEPDTQELDNVITELAEDDDDPPLPCGCPRAIRDPMVCGAIKAHANPFVPYREPWCECGCHQVIESEGDHAD